MRAVTSSRKRCARPAGVLSSCMTGGSVGSNGCAGIIGAFSRSSMACSSVPAASLGCASGLGARGLGGRGGRGFLGLGAAACAAGSAAGCASAFGAGFASAFGAGCASAFGAGFASALGAGFASVLGAGFASVLGAGFASALGAGFASAFGAGRCCGFLRGCVSPRLKLPSRSLRPWSSSRSSSMTVRRTRAGLLPNRPKRPFAPSCSTSTWTSAMVTPSAARPASMASCVVFPVNSWLLIRCQPPLLWQPCGPAAQNTC